MHIESFASCTEPDGRCPGRLASCHGHLGNACRDHLASRQVLVVLLHIQWAESYLVKPFELDGWEILTVISRTITKVKACCHSRV
jgi:hypothetical protein